MFDKELLSFILFGSDLFGVDFLEVIVVSANMHRFMYL